MQTDSDETNTKHAILLSENLKKFWLKIPNLSLWGERKTQEMNNSYFCQLLWSKVFVFATNSDVSAS